MGSAERGTRITRSSQNRTHHWVTRRIRRIFRRAGAISLRATPHALRRRRWRAVRVHPWWNVRGLLLIVAAVGVAVHAPVLRLGEHHGVASERLATSRPQPPHLPRHRLHASALGAPISRFGRCMHPSARPHTRTPPNLGHAQQPEQPTGSHSGCWPTGMATGGSAICGRSTAVISNQKEARSAIHRQQYAVRSTAVRVNRYSRTAVGSY
eukprot:COSAG01_NODE_11699_length_1877_cov_35.838583_2_plen_210_part_00